MMLSEEHKSILAAKAQRLVKDGKGLLLLDRDPAKFTQIFNKFGVDNTWEARNMCYESIISTKDIENYISGIVFCREALLVENSAKLRSACEKLVANNISVGIMTTLESTKITEDESIAPLIDNLETILGNPDFELVDFIVVRVLFRASATTPSTIIMNINSEIIRKCASIAQKNNKVVIFEPDVKYTGTWSIVEAALAHKKIISTLIKCLSDHNVYLQGTLLQICFSNNDGFQKKKCFAEDPAVYTFSTLMSTVPPAIPGVFLYDNGSAIEDSCKYLRKIKLGKGKHMWRINFGVRGDLLDSFILDFTCNNKNLDKAQNNFLDHFKPLYKAVNDP